MPDVFLPTVYEKVAKAHPKLLRRLQPEHFGSYQGINEALGWLPPQDRCDAVYADWLESLNLSAGGTLLRVRMLKTVWLACHDSSTLRQSTARSPFSS